MSRKSIAESYKGGARRYELVFIAKQTLSQDSVNKKLEEVKNMIVENKGEIDESYGPILRTFAYPIESKQNQKGFYCCVCAKIDPSFTVEIRRRLLIDDDILRVLIVLSSPARKSKGIFEPGYDEEFDKSKKRSLYYSDPNFLIRFIGERGKISPKKQTIGKKIEKGISAKQRKISKEIKRARYLSLLSYVGA